MSGAIFFKIESRLPYQAGTYVANLVSIRQEITVLQRCDNSDFFLLLIFSRGGVPSSWPAAQHTTVCLLDAAVTFTCVFHSFALTKKVNKLMQLSLLF